MAHLRATLIRLKKSAVAGRTRHLQFVVKEAFCDPETVPTFRDLSLLNPPPENLHKACLDFCRVYSIHSWALKHLTPKNLSKIWRRVSKAIGSQAYWDWITSKLYTTLFFSY